MLNQSLEPTAPLTPRDITRLAIAALGLIVILTAILAADFFPQPLKIAVGDVATADIGAPRALEYESKVKTDKLRTAARDGVDPQYDFTTEHAIEIAKEQLRLLDQRVSPIDQAFAADTPEDERNTLLTAALEGIPDDVRLTLVGLTPE